MARILCPDLRIYALHISIWPQWLPKPSHRRVPQNGHPLRIKVSGSKIRLSIGIFELFSQPFIFSGAVIGKFLPVLGCGRLFLQMRKIEFFGGPPGKFSGYCHPVFHSDTGHRNKRTHIHRHKTRMLAGMNSHINFRSGYPRGRQNAFNNRLRITNKGLNGPVGQSPGVYIKQPAAGSLSDGVSNGINGLLIAPFGKIRDTFDTILQSPIVKQPPDFAREPGYRRQDNKRFSPNPDMPSVQAVSGSKFFALYNSKLYLLWIL